MNIIDILYKLSPFFISIILFIKSNKKLITSLKIIILLKIIIHLINDYTNYNIVNYIEYLLFTLTVIILLLFLYVNKIKLQLIHLILLAIAFLFFYKSVTQKSKISDILWHLFIALFLFKII